jgi:hypothetical protein
LSGACSSKSFYKPGTLFGGAVPTFSNLTDPGHLPARQPVPPLMLIGYRGGRLMAKPRATSEISMTWLTPARSPA